MEAEERARITRGDKIAWYDRNIPLWWEEFNKLFADPIWRGNDFLDSYCRKWFGVPEAEMRAFLKGEWRDYQPRPKKEIRHPVVLAEAQGASFEEQAKRAMTPAEKQRAYRERRKREKYGPG